MLDKLLVELNTNKSFKEESSEEKELDLFNKLEVCREHEKELDKNIINDLFAGFYETSYYCQNIKNKITYSFQSEYFLLFEIEKIKNYFKTKELSIELCFSYYLRSQNKNSFFCNNCKEIEEGNCNEGIYRPPKILVLILDRGHGKIFDVKIRFKEYLDLKNIIKEENYEYSSCYQLICVLNSKANYSSGIYTACCLTDNNSYYYFSDKNSIMIDREKLFEDEPYILFYKRIEDQYIIKSNEEKYQKEKNIKDDIIQNNSKKEIKKEEINLEIIKIKEKNKIKNRNKNKNRYINNNYIYTSFNNDYYYKNNH